MPYIKKERRSHLALYDSITVGELNYTVTKICSRYLKDRGESYQTYNDIIGVLECAKLEMYRRKVAHYEDKRKKENGDVY